MTRRKLRKIQKKERRLKAGEEVLHHSLPDFLPGDRVIANSDILSNGEERSLNGEVLKVIKNENKPGYHYQVSLLTGKNRKQNTYLDGSKIHLNEEIYSDENLKNRLRTMFMLYEPSFIPPM